MITLKYIVHFIVSPLYKENHYQIKTKNIRNSFRTICDKIETSKPLYYIRFGDGEILAIMRKDHRNYKYNPQLTNELKESYLINHPNYLIAAPINYPYDRYWSKGIYKSFSWDKEMEDSLINEGLHTKELYENPCIFQVLALHKPKLVYQFLEKWIRPHKKMFIGGVPKEQAEQLYGPIDYYVQTPFKHAYEEVDKWWPEIEKNMHNVDVIIPSVGSSSNIIAKRLWENKVQANVLDIGSIIDALGPKPTRTWIRLLGHRIYQLIPADQRPTFSRKQKMSFLLKDIKFFFRNQVI